MSPTSPSHRDLDSGVVVRARELQTWCRTAYGHTWAALTEHLLSDPAETELMTWLCTTARVGFRDPVRVHDDNGTWTVSNGTHRVVAAAVADTDITVTTRPVDGSDTLTVTLTVDVGPAAATRLSAAASMSVVRPAGEVFDAVFDTLLAVTRSFPLDDDRWVETDGLAGLVDTDPVRGERLVCDGDWYVHPFTAGDTTATAALVAEHLRRRIARAGVDDAVVAVTATRHGF